MKNILRLLTSGLFAAFFVLAARAADLAPGAYSAGTVNGDVTYALAGSDKFEALAAGTALPQGVTIKTGASSSVIIVFSNGATASIAPNSLVEVTKFEQELFSGPIKVDAEPSVSNTEIKIIDGGVVNKVAKLKKGSSYTVNSPVGAAGVRGTVFAVFYSKVTGKAVVRVVNGKVVFTDRKGGQTGVEAGQKLDASVTTTSTGTVEAVAIDVSKLTEAEKAELVALLQEVGTVTTSNNGNTITIVPDPTQVSTN